MILHNSNAMEKTLPSCCAILLKNKAKAHPIYLTLMISFVITVVTFCFTSEPSISIVIIIISLFVHFFPCQNLQSWFRQPLLWISLCCQMIQLPSSFPGPTLLILHELYLCALGHSSALFWSEATWEQEPGWDAAHTSQARTASFGYLSPQKPSQKALHPSNSILHLPVVP